MSLASSRFNNSVLWQFCAMLDKKTQQAYTNEIFFLIRRLESRARLGGWWRVDSSGLETPAGHPTAQPLSFRSQPKNVALPRRRRRTHGRSPTRIHPRSRRSGKKYRQRHAYQTDRCRASPRKAWDDRRPLRNGQSATNIMPNILQSALTLDTLL